MRNKVPTDKLTLKDPGKSNIDYKEVEQNERREFNEFREWERTRRVAKGERGINPTAQYVAESFELSRRSNLPSGPIKSNPEFTPLDNRTQGDNRKIIKLD